MISDDSKGLTREPNLKFLQMGKHIEIQIEKWSEKNGIRPPQAQMERIVRPEQDWAKNTASNVEGDKDIFFFISVIWSQIIISHIDNYITYRASPLLVVDWLIEINQYWLFYFQSFLALDITFHKCVFKGILDIVLIKIKVNYT